MLHVFEKSEHSFKNFLERPIAYRKSSDSNAEGAALVVLLIPSCHLSPSPKQPSCQTNPALSHSTHTRIVIIWDTSLSLLCRHSSPTCPTSPYINTLPLAYYVTTSHTSATRFFYLFFCQFLSVGSLILHIQINTPFL